MKKMISGDFGRVSLWSFTYGGKMMLFASIYKGKEEVISGREQVIMGMMYSSGGEVNSG